MNNLNCIACTWDNGLTVHVEDSYRTVRVDGARFSPTVAVSRAGGSVILTANANTPGRTRDARAAALSAFASLGTIGVNAARRAVIRSKDTH